MRLLCGTCTDCHIILKSVVVLRAKLIEKLCDQVPNTITFDVGFYDGQQHSKIWLCSNKDLEAMYRKHPTGEITLWCDGCTAADEDTTGRNKHKKDDSSGGPSKRQKKEEGVDSVFKELKEKHGNKFDTLHLCLWAHMVANDMHDDLRIPQIYQLFASHQRDLDSSLFQVL